jgi:hypothetical protein
LAAKRRGVVGKTPDYNAADRWLESFSLKNFCLIFVAEYYYGVHLIIFDIKNYYFSLKNIFKIRNLFNNLLFKKLLFSK